MFWHFSSTNRISFDRPRCQPHTVASETQISLTRQFSALQLDIRLELRMLFLISSHLNSLHQLQHKKKRLNNRRRRTRFRQSLAPTLSTP